MHNTMVVFSLSGLGFRIKGIGGYRVQGLRLILRV